MNETPPAVPAVPAAPAPPRKGRGCLFWGGISVLMIFAMGALAVFLVVHYVRKEARFLVTDILDTKPLALPKVVPAAGEVEALQQRVAGFMQALDAGSNAAPLVLNSIDLNNWINSNRDSEDSSNQVQVAIEGDTIKAQVSVALGAIEIPLLGVDLKGRYLNGSASLRVVLTNGILWANLDSFEARGKSLPKEFQPFLQAQNLAQGFASDPTNAAGIRRLESVVVKDGKLVLTAKSGK